MVPAAYVRLAELPLTINGKIDRKALPAPEADAYSTRAYEAPQGEVEETIADIWTGLLKLERVGRHDHFFELGGHSLLAVTLMERIQHEFSVSLELQILFSHPTIALLAECIVEAQLAQYDSEALIGLMREMNLGG
jgi:syringomycin synthetase protein SyrE